jgi:hypothetical protein
MGPAASNAEAAPVSTIPAIRVFVIMGRSYPRTADRIIVFIHRHDVG